MKAFRNIDLADLDGVTPEQLDALCAALLKAADREEAAGSDPHGSPISELLGMERDLGELAWWWRRRLREPSTRRP